MQDTIRYSLLIRYIIQHFVNSELPDKVVSHFSKLAHWHITPLAHNSVYLSQKKDRGSGIGHICPVSGLFVFYTNQLNLRSIRPQTCASLTVNLGASSRNNLKRNQYEISNRKSIRVLPAVYDSVFIAQITNLHSGKCSP